MSSLITRLRSATRKPIGDNERLSELKRRYMNHPATKHSLWTDSYLRRELNLQNFRADNAYVYQKRLSSEAAYALTAQYVAGHDELGLLNKLEDDDLFGNTLVDFDGNLMVSRDLLDSILEINFLNRELDLSKKSRLTFLDIGAGYGRFAHRLVQSLPNVEKIICTDAIAESTFVSEYYLRFRGVDHKAEVVPLDEVEDRLSNCRVNVAVNIHSFGECTLQSINWWLDLIRKNETQFLFVVANGDSLGSRETNGANIDYMPSITARGYKLMTQKPKFFEAPSVQKYGLYPTWYFLFEKE